MPVYNGERYITETLDSLLAQTYRDFELVISDNASQDRTEEICCSYAGKDPRVRYARNATNLGAPRNYRRVFELSSGEYFRWANCDDLFSPTSLERCVEVLDRNPSVVLTYPKTKLIDQRGRIISDYEDGLHLQSERASQRFVQLCLGIGLVNAIYGLMRADTLRKTRLIGNFIAADVPLLAELSLYGKFWEIPECLFFRRLHPGAYSSYTSVDQLQEFVDPKSTGRVPFTQWSHLWANCRAAFRAPVSPLEKLRLSNFLIRNVFWNRQKLTDEVVTGIRRMLRSMNPSK
jgi:glycosyltransferase involved in cell wall biosynthesis